MDDFAWLALPQRIDRLGGIWATLFKPLAQGTIRPWSERLFFMAGWHFFGFEAAVPMRAVVFLTMFANFALLTVLTRRITNSGVAAFAAPVLWLVNSSLYVPMSWTAAYNQILCAFFLLLALNLFARGYYAAQWIVFVLGFGALEVNVVYPALATLYAWCFARERVKSTLPMWGVSIAYAVLHRALAPPQRTDIYHMYFDLEIFETLRKYVIWAVSADRYAEFRNLPVWPHYVAAAIVLGAIAFFACKAKRVGIFGLGWFFIVLAPVLPLKNHISDYYLAIPAAGLAIVMAHAVRRFHPAVVMILLVYAIPSAWLSNGMTKEYFRVSRRVRTFVRSVAYAHRLHPDQTLLIRNMDSELFWAAWWDNPFQILGRTRIFVAAEDEGRIAPFREMGTLSRFFLAPTAAIDGMRAGNVVAYELVNDRLRNVTILYRSMLERREGLQLPKYLDIREPSSQPHLIEGWWEPEPSHRWMSRRGVLLMRGPRGTDGELVLKGTCPDLLIEQGPVQLTVTTNGVKHNPSTIGRSNLQFEFRYPVKASEKLTILIEASRTVQVPGDKRAVSVAFGSAEVIP